jgi:hypothetical protein
MVFSFLIRHDFFSIRSLLVGLDCANFAFEFLLYEVMIYGIYYGIWDIGGFRF